MTFSFVYDWSPKANVTPTIRSTKFGEGFEFRQGTGMNPNVETWDLVFALRDMTEGNAIISFLETCGGVDSFDWTNPRGIVGKYICRSWPHSVENFDRLTISASFEKVYDL